MPTDATRLPADVALLAPPRLAPAAFAGCLTAAEQARCARFARPERQARFVAGRLAAKYLFLQRLDGAAPAPLARLTPEALGDFSPWMYRAVEILPDAGGVPRLAWNGRPRPERVSVAHTDGLTVASLAEAGPLGLDVEQALPRRDAFYAGNFTPGERRWVARSAWATGVPFTWLYTLLWTLKEALLKAHLAGPPLSLWDFRRLELDVLTNARTMAAAYRSPRVGEVVRHFDVAVAGPHRRARVRVALAATEHLILTILRHD